MTYCEACHCTYSRSAREEAKRSDNRRCRSTAVLPGPSAATATSSALLKPWVLQRLAELALLVQLAAGNSGRVEGPALT